jgi:hypothetical protein
MMSETTVSENDEDTDVDTPVVPLASLLTDSAHARSLSPGLTTSSTIRPKGSRASITSTQQQVPSSLGIQPHASEFLVNDHTAAPVFRSDTRSRSKASQSTSRLTAPPRQRNSFGRKFFAPWLGRETTKRHPH